MKKFLMSTSVAILILGLAAATYAMEVNVSGNWFTMTGWYLNTQQGQLQDGPDDPASAVNTGFDDTNARARTRARFKIDGVASEDLHGVLQFEMGEAIWGAPDEIARWGADARTLEVKHAYVDFKVPGTDAFPTRATIGVQDFLLGGPWALDDDGAGVELTTTVGPASIQLMWMKQAEGDDYEADDVDGYALGVSFPVGPVTPTVWTIYNTMGKGYAQAVTPGIPTGLVDESGYSWHVGAGVTGKVGPVALEGDFAFMTGEIDYSIPFADTGWLGQTVLRDGEEYSGFGLRFKGSVPLGIVEVGGEFMYTSGDDLEDIANDREFSYRRPLTGGAAYHPGVVYYSSAINWNVGIAWMVGPTIGTDPGGPTGATEYTGDWIAGVFATVKPLDWLSVTLKGLYNGDTVKNGDRFGTALDYLGRPEDNDSAGIEFDVIANIKIYENLSYDIAAGYLLAGDALDQYDAGTTATMNAAGVPGYFNESPKNPWCVVSYLSYSF